MAAANALTSIWGSGHAKAVQANRARVRDCVAGAGQRNQVVLTPRSVCEALERFWPAGVACDPCSAPEQLLEADWRPEDGLAVDWPERTYCNPPYGTLKPWLAHGAKYSEVVWLVPVRTHRKWFRPWLASLDVRLALDPLKFAGHKFAYPTPVMLGYRGARDREFFAAFGHLGGVF